MTIMQATLPVGEMNPVNSETSRSTGLGLAVDVGGADWGTDACAATDEELVASGLEELVHPETTSKATALATADVGGLPGGATARR
ncbi:hypothetical protein [Mycolicibacterium gadium]|jgi:hypothetical protein|nr:hypothetical protein [Mycolicibacterium gadium]